MKKAEFIARYGEEAYQRKLESNRERSKQWNRDNKEKIAEYYKRYYKKHKEEILEYKKQWREDNPEYIKQYRQTQYGRASHLCGCYRAFDKQYNRGECTLTPEWIINNIYNSTCIYCGENDWAKLGCDRIDNSKPHTPDNVVCCCTKCNIKKGSKSVEDFLQDY